MTYNFDEIIPRQATASYKWDSDGAERTLPMWVADMDFRTAPAVTEALRRRVDHGVFGYTRVPDDYYRAVASWFARRHGWNIQREWIVYTSGVVPALSAVIKALTQPGDKVIAQTPVYNCFFSSIRNNGCQVAENPLAVDAGGAYRVDFDDLERKAADPLAKVMLLCNPHNPVGRVWTREELERMGEICLRNGVTVVADEIHCELVAPGRRYTPFATVADELRRRSVVCVSPSKAFNLAGLQIANIVIPDPETRRRVDRAININEVCDVNPFGVAATIAAYDEGEPWLNQLNAYIHDNYLFFREFCREKLPDFPIAELEGTYLVWMDCRRLRMASDLIEERLRAATGLWLNAGSMYGAAGEGFMRWNIACPRSVVADGLRRFLSFVGSL